MPLLVGYMLLFIVVGVGFILIHLLAGKLIRPSRPDAEKLTIYECGEPTIGSAWVQFDLRFYVVALLFVIFDVEVAFFFPWATVFGRANQLRTDLLSVEERAKITRELSPNEQPQPGGLVALVERRTELIEARKTAGASTAAIDGELRQLDQKLAPLVQENRQAAQKLGWIAFFDILVFFGVLLVGFAYLWRRGDLEWVRSTAAERLAARGLPPPDAAARERELARTSP